MYKLVKDEKNVKNKLNKSLYNNIIIEKENKKKIEEKKKGGLYKKDPDSYNTKSFFEKLILYWSSNNSNYLTDNDKMILSLLIGVIFVILFFIIILFFIYIVIPPENIKIQEQIDKLKVNLEPIRLIQNSNIDLKNLDAEQEENVVSNYFDLEAFLMPYKKSTLNYREIPTAPVAAPPVAVAQPPVTSAFISLGNNSLNNNNNVVVEKSVNLLKKLNGITLDSIRTKVNNYFRILTIDKEPYVIFKMSRQELQSSNLNTALRFYNR